MAHARIKPSAAGRWVHCPGSITMEEIFPETGRSEAAEEGTASHWVASETLSGHGGGSFLGRTAPNGVIITQEMIDGAKEFVGYIASLGANVGLRGVEASVKIDRVHSECWGTPDYWWFDKSARALHVFDYKYGWGIVEAFENWQGICYISGVIDLLASMEKIPVGQFDQTISVILHIVQPRPFHSQGSCRSWNLDKASGLLRGYINRLNAAAEKALGLNPQCIAGHYCRYCSARHACPAAQNSALFAIDYAFAATPQLLDPAAMAIELKTLQRVEEAIKYRLTGLQTQVLELLKSGATVPGFGIEYGQGRKTWNCQEQEIIALGELFGIDLKAPDKAVTPAQAIAKGLDPELVKSYSETPTTGMKLVGQENTLAAQVFGGGP